MFESKSFILLVAGLGFFVFAFLSNAIVPVLMYQDMPEQSAEQLVTPRLMALFKDIEFRYPEPFEKHIGEATEANAAEALRLGRDVYVGEGCWHCHSQFIRPVSNESKRWGPVASSEEYQNELQRPVLFGTRRVGPDLSREGGVHGTDWQAVHLFNPKLTSPETVMPSYPWLFDGSPIKPNKSGISLIMYLQWQGTWLDEYPDYKNQEGAE